MAIGGCDIIPGVWKLILLSSTGSEGPATPFPPTKCIVPVPPPPPPPPPAATIWALLAAS